MGATSVGNSIRSLPVDGMEWVGVKETVAVERDLTILGFKLKASPAIVPDAACHVMPEVSSAILLSLSSRI